MKFIYSTIFKFLLVKAKNTSIDLYRRNLNLFFLLHRPVASFTHVFNFRRIFHTL